MNSNQIQTDDFSNPESERLYNQQWPDEPEVLEQYEEGGQCGACSFFAPFNSDWGLCCNRDSRHHLETVFEHFSCPSLAREGWGAHTFSSNPRSFCRCGQYTPLPEDVDLLCLSVRVEEVAEDRYKATLVVNERLSVEDPSSYFAIKELTAQVTKRLTDAE